MYEAVHGGGGGGGGSGRGGGVEEGLPQQQQLQQPQQPDFVAMMTEFYQHVGETGKCGPQHIQKALNKYKGNETKMFMKMIKKYKEVLQC